MPKHISNEQILQKNLYLINELRSSPVKILMAELLTILLDNVLTIRDATRYLKDKYHKKEIPDWVTMSEHDIQEEVRACLQFRNEKQWKIEAQKIDQKQSPERKQIEDFMQAKNIRVEDRISRVKQLIEKCEKDSRVCQQEQIFLQKRSQLSLLKKELRFLQLKNQIHQRSSVNEGLTDNLRLEIMECVNLAKQKHEQVIINASVSVSPSKKLNMKRLNEVYNHYKAKVQKPIPIFQEQSPQAQNLTIKGFMQIVKDFKLGEGLTPNQIYDLFKIFSKGCKHIHFIEFLQLLRRIHQSECEKSGLPSSELTQNKYIYDNILNTKTIEVILHKKAYPEKLSNYEFKVIPHSGKTKEQIMDELTRRKDSKLIAEQQMRIDKSLSPQKIKFSQQSTGDLKLKKSTPQQSPIKRRKASQACIFSKQERSQTPIETILHLFPPDEDPYLSNLQEKKSSVALPSLHKKAPRYFS